MGGRYWHGISDQGVVFCPYPFHLVGCIVSVQHSEEGRNRHLNAFEKVGSEFARLENR